MLTTEENDRLMQVGRGTPMGDLMRTSWLPVGITSDLEPGGAPLPVRLLGEELVLFRTIDGTIGLIGEHCPHRGASLLLARNLDCSLECIYHGWKIAPDGQVEDMPAEPERSKFKTRFRHDAYKVAETAGVVWAYLGDGEPPAVPSFEWSALPADHVLAARAVVRCNWSQALEGAIDSAHQTYLHDARSRIDRDRAHVERIAREGGDLTDGFDETGQVVRPWNDGAPRLQVESTPYGFRYAAIRKPMIYEDRFQNVRVSHFVAPVFVIIPGPAGWAQLLAHVPMDDEQTMFWHVRANLEAPYADDDRRVHLAAAGVTPGVDVDDRFYRRGTRENRWLQDRDEMRFGDRLSGIHGTVNEDHAVMESMGPRYDRTKEHLGTSDMAVIRFRKLMLEASRRSERGEPPLGDESPTDLRGIRGEDRTIRLDEPWQSVGLVGSRS
ncbi:MAG: Rieske 2Fe-2S domain-containing protein [Acidimicrobiia bacterium]